MTKELEQSIQRAVELFMQGYGCCQSVLCAFADRYGMDEETALSRLSEHQPNNQICILNQEVIEKYLSFKEVIVL